MGEDDIPAVERFQGLEHLGGRLPPPVMRVRAPADDPESSFGGDLGRELGQMPPRNPPPAWRDAVLVERCEDAVDVVFDGGSVGLRMPQVLVPVHFDGMPFGY